MENPHPTSSAVLRALWTGMILGGHAALAQSVVFDANFNAATAVSGTVTANATKANLDAGTAVGNWTVAASPPGAVIANAALSNKSFVFDKATSGLSENSVTANFSQSVDLATKTLSLEMDLYAVRQANNQAVVFSLGDAAGNPAFEFTFRMNNTKQFLAPGFSASQTFITSNATGVNNGFKNPAVNGYLDWGATMTRVRIDVSSSTLATMSVDWNGDGDYADASEWMTTPIGPKSSTVSTLGTLLISNLSSVNGGAWIDNVKVTSADKPASTTSTSFNLAKYQTTTTDSSLTSWPSQFATDGFVTQDSRWVSSSTGPHWLEVELATPMTVGSAHLYSGGTSDSAMSNFVLQYQSGTSWLDIGGTSRSSNSASVLNLAFTSPVTAQKFRLYTTNATARVVDLALYAPTADGSPVPFGTDVDLNMAKMRQYAYSSLSGTNYPKLAFDGHAHNGSVWASANTAGPHDLEIHFPHAEKIGGIHLYSGYAGQNGTQIQNFEVAYDSGGTWVVFGGGSVTGNTDFERSIQFTTPATTQKIRLRSLDATQAIVRELVVLPTVSGTWFPLWTDARNEPPPAQSFLEYEDSYHTLQNRAAGTRLSTSDTGSVLTSDEPWFQVLLNIGSNTYRIRSRETGRCFEVSQASTADGAAIVEGTYSSMPHQRWELQPVDGTWFRIVNVWSGKVLGTSGTNVVQQAANGSTNQQWKINYKTHYPKRGQASFFHYNPLYKPSWFYGWNFDQEAECEYGQYAPMQWGGMAAASPALLRYQPEWFRRASQTTVLGFNEPDKTDQANVSEATAAYQWPRFERMRLPLVTPCTAQNNGSWRQTYEATASTEGLRCEYMSLHWYAGCNGGNPDNIINVVNSLYSAYGKPVWITEFAVKDWSGTSTAWNRNDNFNWLAEFLWRAEGIAHLKKYSLFEWGTEDNNADPTVNNAPTMGLHVRNDKDDPGWEDLSECGLLLAGWDGDTTIRDEKAYIIHNKARKMRLIDAPGASTIGSANILNRIATEQFILQPGPNGRKYIVGLSDGRRLHYNGSVVGLSPAGTTGTAVEWQLQEHQHGWFYINHPATGRRLNMDGSNNINTALNTVTTDNTRFRFIAPAQPTSLAQVQSLPYAESFENGIGAWRQFYDDGYDWEVGSGGTPSPAAGPSGASDGQFYLFAEGHDSTTAGDVTQVECVFDLSTVNDVELSFDYHMYGAYIDYLAVDVFDGTTWINNFWFKDNQQHTSKDDPWTRAEVNLTSFAGNPAVTIRFRTARTVWNSADPAIDNIRIDQSQKLPYAESFEQGLGAWVQLPGDDFNWSLHSGYTDTPNTGPSGASHGNQYIYLEGHDNGIQYKSSLLGCKFDLSGVNTAEMTFDYHMYGQNIDYLALDVYNGSTWTLDVWKRSEQQQTSSEDPWLTAVVDLTPYAGINKVTLRFRSKNKQWHAADMALDNIRVNEIPTSPYATWSAGHSLAGGFDDDDDRDGIANGMEFVLNGNPQIPNTTILPTAVKDATHLKFSYTRTADSKASTAQTVQWSTDLTTWTDIVVDPSGPDSVTVDIPLTHAVNGKLYARLKVALP